MKFLNRKLAKLANSTTQNPSGEVISHREPEGHLHENFRHWNWFKPSNQRAQ